MLHRRVGVDDELDFVDVHAARGDVGCDEHPHAALRGIRTECGEVALARRLRQVAVQIDGRDAGRGEHLRERLRLVLGAGEEDASAATGGEVPHECGLLVVADHEDAVGHLALRHALVVDLMADLVAEELADESVHTAVERGAEKHALAALRSGREDAGDTGQEAEVGHVVGLVQDGDLDPVEAHARLA